MILRVLVCVGLLLLFAASANQPRPIELGIDAQGLMTWNGTPLASYPAFEAKLAQASIEQPRPEIHIRPNRNVRYEKLRRVLALIQHYGFHIGIVGNMQATP